jgi:hypothetical protein
MEAVLAETRRLDREGKLDEEAMNRPRVRIEAAGRLLEAESQARIARIHAEVEAILHPPKPPLRVRITLLSVTLVVIGGILETTIGTSFIFAAGARYRTALPWVLVALVPLMACLLVLGERRTHAFRRKYPTPAVRWLMFSLVVALAVGATVVAPLGWIAAYGLLAGTPVQDVEARLISLADPQYSSRSCRQKGDVEWQGEQATLCVSDHVTGPAPRDGDLLRLGGLRSAAGLYVQRIQKR